MGSLLQPKTLFSILTVVALVWSVPETGRLIRHIRERDKGPPPPRLPDEDATYPEYGDLWWCCGVAALLIVVRLATIYLLKPLGEKLIPKGRWSDRVRDMKVERFGSAAFKTTYFVCVVAFGYRAVRHTDWLPASLGGSGATIHFWSADYVPAAVKWYYVVNMGYYLHSFVYDMAMSPRRPDFAENTLHHIVILLLMVFSFLYRSWVRVGSAVMLLHDACDVLVYLCRTLVDTRFTRVTFGFFLALLGASFYLRLYVFKWHVLDSIIYEMAVERRHGDGVAWLAYLLATLGLLHVYWYTLMVKMFCVYVQSGETTDLPAKLTDVQPVYSEDDRPLMPPPSDNSSLAFHLSANTTTKRREAPPHDNSSSSSQGFSRISTNEGSNGNGVVAAGAGPGGNDDKHM
ncbi:unnamed protein product [Vitrella brassicaformis CCMP3155]|uniref:TLC domain-containing protein n=1 Tax=Vitrella brassicaformis (strain CCMP3155) TaxID=1169540 RepID=A0A0G4G5H5_VITBC|nr:unnamed protein product [Vitrella brassicaformis CCMP3155]|mmetsp:Transcript_10518/g.25507  ORF Transcript_10518/g.25507 Transcript_10518/m.25507 type:complete len:402 (-) Transcript_10518:35-1240(-)|eukprot:CEM23717.1 unnamed protein product [Vitrella brassicaformis CCMP3155]